MKKTVAVIGAAESTGSAIAYGLAAAGHRVLLTDDIEKRLTPFLGRLPLLLAKIRFEVSRADARIVFSAREACWEADVVILTAPAEAQAEIACRIKDVVTQKIVVSVRGPLGKTSDDVGPVPVGMATEELTQLLPHSRIVRVFHADPPAGFGLPVPVS